MLSMRARDADRWLRWWLWALNAATLTAGAAWWLGGNRRAGFLLAFVPLFLVPFSFARLRTVAALRGYLPVSLGHWITGFGLLGMVCYCVMLAQMLIARSPEAAAIFQGPVVGWVGPVWFSAHALYFLGFSLANLARGSVGAGRRVVHRLRRRKPAVPDPVQMERRLFLKQVGVMSVGAPFAISLSGVPLSYDFRVDERELHLPHWPRELDGLRVAHLSDIHVGGAMNRERLLRVAELTNEARPDLVLHTGDFLTHRTGDFDLPLYEALGRIRAPLGQWACLGNHDYDDVTRFVRRLREAGVTSLHGEVTQIDLQGQRFEVAGLDFAWDRDDRTAIYRRTIDAWAPREQPRLLLNHDPSGFASLPPGCADLVCSGHTHGGHIGFQLGPDLAFTVIGLVGLPDQGVFERGDMRLFVTRCVGFYGYPMRLGIPPEISLLTLRSA